MARLNGAPVNAEVTVSDNNVDQAMRARKGKLRRDGVFREMRDKQFFTPPTQQRRIEKQKYLSRIFKAKVKDLQKQGLT